MEEEARRELARVAAEGLEPFRESFWLASLTYLTDAAAALGDEAMAALVYPELEPLAGANVMIGHLVAFYGAADRYLGMLAATLGEWERAEDHLERAIEMNRRMGAHDVARSHRLRTRPGPARGPRRAAIEPRRCSARPRGLAERIGMPALLGRVGGAGIRRAGDGLPDGLSAREVEILRLVARGLSNREIGRSLFISEHTAANHMRNILRKTDCANRTEAASYAHRQGLIEPDRPSGTIPDDAALHDRAHLRGPARSHLRRRQADRGHQRGRGRPLAVLVSERRPATHLLPVRGALARRDHAAAARRANIPSDEIVEVGPATAELSDRLRDWAASQVDA